MNQHAKRCKLMLKYTREMIDRVWMCESLDKERDVSGEVAPNSHAST